MGKVGEEANRSNGFCSSDMKLELEPGAGGAVFWLHEPRMISYSPSRVIFNNNTEAVEKNMATTIGRKEQLFTSPREGEREGEGWVKIHRERLRSPILTSAPSFIILIFLHSSAP